MTPQTRDDVALGIVAGIVIFCALVALLIAR